MNEHNFKRRSIYPRNWKPVLERIAFYGTFLMVLLILALNFLVRIAVEEDKALLIEMRAIERARIYEAQNEPVSLLPDPCSLESVICSNEQPTPLNPSLGEPHEVIYATVTSYQAVPEQTDGSPCSGAMPGINFCDPPFLIVANNCLPLGTEVAIGFNIYTVADRMNERYGCDYFDVLTDGATFTLTNEPVTIL